MILGSKVKDETNNIWIIKSKGKTILEEDDDTNLLERSGLA
jgi:hypothetical protein